jgi:geranylgeranyl transferase type-2 subunit alpha
VYWIWNHRRWCLENIPDGPDDSKEWKKDAWDGELYVVEKMLDADSRNFQAWNYRRYVLASMPVPRSLASEFNYTTRKIESNFSNFSAWHQRSKVLTAMWDKGELDPVETKEEEFDIIRNAMYTDPGDQSVWVYQRWLVGREAPRDILQREIDAIQELLDEEPESKWCMESLVHYKQQLLQNHREHVDAATLTDQCIGLLGRLKSIDPSRKMRYIEIEQELGSIPVN